MKYIHTKCGGIIDLRTRKCTGCKKKWGRLGLWFDPKGVRPMQETRDFKTYTKQEEITSLQKAIRDKIPGGRYAVGVANILPKWPRWARVTVTVVTVGGLVGLITWLIVR